MTCYPSQSALLEPVAWMPSPLLRAEELMLEYGLTQERLGWHQPHDRSAAVATALMDLFRVTGCREVFDALVAVARPHLESRVRSRLRLLGPLLDPQEILQDALVNVYRYPDRFLASRPGAFAAWSSTIIDNVIRRALRKRGRQLAVPVEQELLVQQCDPNARGPDEVAEEREQAAVSAKAFCLLLLSYLSAYMQLSDRERAVLHMVEVMGLRYADVALRLAVRPEALKMVVFRARRRLFDRMAGMLCQCE